MDWDTVLDTFTLPRYEALQKEWEKAPPLNICVAAFAGYYAVVAHTDWTRLETAGGAAVTAFVGYVVNRLRNLNV